MIYCSSLLAQAEFFTFLLFFKYFLPYSSVARPITANPAYARILSCLCFLRFPIEWPLRILNLNLGIILSTIYDRARAATLSFLLGSKTRPVEGLASLVVF